MNKEQIKALAESIIIECTLDYVQANTPKDFYVFTKIQVHNIENFAKEILSEVEK